MRLTKADALAAARRLLVDDPRPPSGKRVVKPWTSYAIAPAWAFPKLAATNPMLVRLGWFVPKGATVARLAWKVPYRVDRHGIRDAWGDLLAIMIDAITGKRLPSTRLSGLL